MTKTNETGRQRLERLRAEVAELDRAAAETVVPVVAPERDQAALPVVPGDQIHALRTGVTFGTGGGFLSASHVSRRGETYTITQALIDASKDANGSSWLRHLATEEAQLATWGEVRFGLGPAPVDLLPEHGTAEWRASREEARQSAWREPDSDRRAAALAAVNEKFGPAPVTSTVLSTAPDPSIAAAEAQRKALDEGGVRLRWDYVAQEPGVRR
ncbi:hypothetical protein [Microbacterium sp. BLY]|uniref:hypothetical protein n=1 Tax=Microbacterium sp. BLY TaxID=2823280 RepID=UPI001B325F16|nr:hypothetical protein [Microbacterium sp. BLY]MBP3978693.1 hypothetical protein [Microbacterium sp. BLY]